MFLKYETINVQRNKFIKNKLVTTRLGFLATIRKILCTCTSLGLNVRARCFLGLLVRNSKQEDPVGSLTKKLPNADNVEQSLIS